jgi:type II secretory pathway component HofQ
MNDLLVRVCLAVLLVASAEASELLSPEGDGCTDETFEKATEQGWPTGQKVYTGQKISLDFKDGEIVNVLRILSEVGGENIVVTDDVKGRITVRLIDVPWDQALDIILQMNRLQCVKVGNVPRVSTITRLKEEREAQLAAEQAAEELEPLKTAYVDVTYLADCAPFRGRGTAR